MSNLSPEEGRAIQQIAYYWMGPGPSPSKEEVAEWDKLKSTVRRIASRDIIFLLQLLTKLNKKVSSIPPPR